MNNQRRKEIAEVTAEIQDLSIVSSLESAAE